jgi:hypothetical protein
MHPWFSIVAGRFTFAGREMPRRKAEITQADVARVIRAAKQSGAEEVIVPMGNQSLVVRLAPSMVSKQFEQNSEATNRETDEWRVA